MKDPNEILRQKEEELARLQHEIESLQIVAPLLCDEPAPELPMKDEVVKKKDSAAEKTYDPGAGSEATGTDGPLFGSVASRPSLWNVLKRGK